MSKKAFTSGLDSVFAVEAQYEPNLDASPWLAKTEAVEPAPEAERPRRARPSGERPRSARRSGKSFASDLESLFAAAVNERPREAPAPVETFAQRERQRPRRQVSAFSGLDGLIRDTTGGTALAQRETELQEATSPRKRVTFTYDRDRFARLKSIAREEGHYLKDIISSLLNDYISAYDQDHRAPLGS